MNKKLLSILATLITTVASAYTPIVDIDGLVFLPEKALSRNFCEINPNNPNCQMFREYLRIINEGTHVNQLSEKADQYLIDRYNGARSSRESTEQINQYLTTKATIQALLNNETFINSTNQSVKNLIRLAIEPNLTNTAFDQEHTLLQEAVNNAVNNTQQGELNYKSAQ